MRWVPVFLLLILQLMALADPEKNEIPPDVVKALHAPEKVTLFSLEPWEKPEDKDPSLHGHKILGQAELDAKQATTAILEFETAVVGWDGAIAMCFDPRQAVQVTSQNRVYDLLICYECQQLYIYLNGASVAQLGISGSPKILKEILTKVGLPLSKTEETEEEKAAEREKNKIARKRWEEAMPKPIKPLWDWDEALNNPLYENPKFRDSLSKEYPDKHRQILVLFFWYGSGEGPWTGYGSHEWVAEDLLLGFESAELISAAMEGELDERQTEGAARLFGGGIFSNNRRKDFDNLPAALSKKLLDHTLKSDDEDKRRRAEIAFKRPTNGGKDIPAR